MSMLTDAQLAMIPAHIQKWIARGLCTEPADRATSERTLREMYGYAGLKAPQILWASNPEEMVEPLRRRDTGRQVATAVLQAVVTDVAVAMQSGAMTVVETAAATVMREAMETFMQMVVGSATDKAVNDAVYPITLGPVWGPMWVAMMSAYDGGQLWVAWTAYESFFREACGLVLPGDLTARAAALADYRSSVGPGLWFEKVAILCERPATINPLTWR